MVIKNGILLSIDTTDIVNNILVLPDIKECATGCITDDTIIEELVFSGDVGTIKEGAIDGLENLLSIRFQGKVGVVEDNAFKHCPSISIVKYFTEFGKECFIGNSKQIKIPFKVYPNSFGKYNKFITDAILLSNREDNIFSSAISKMRR